MKNVRHKRPLSAGLGQNSLHIFGGCPDPVSMLAEQITVTLLSGRMAHWGQGAALAAEVTFPPCCTWAGSDAKTHPHTQLSAFWACVPWWETELSSLGGGCEQSAGLAESRQRRVQLSLRTCWLMATLPHTAFQEK